MLAKFFRCSDLNSLIGLVGLVPLEILVMPKRPYINLRAFGVPEFWLHSMNAQEPLDCEWSLGFFSGLTL